MPSIAVIADIHSNLYALNAVIADIEKNNLDQTLVAGDLIGRGPMGSAVVSRIRDLGWPCIRGNHEDYILNFVHQRVPPSWLRNREWSASIWMAAELDRKHVPFLEGLDMTMTSSGNPPLRLHHGSPNGYQDGIGPWTSDEKLQGFLDDMDEDVLVCAHTHRAMHKVLGQKQIVNVGSVGIPFNGDWRAQYAIFHQDQSGRWDVEFRQVEYDREAFEKYYETSGFLREGGITSALLLREIQEARPFLVPFLRWAELMGLPPELDQLPEFLDLYEPHAPLKEQMERFEALAKTQSG